ncbi:D-alanyl-D-alanine carboxypeptidase/D-alanyl-D-alanine-endopeptidase (penicillin-binding protein 4) [Gelidibacter sediminis]|uniref:D-alanyl-D-alanine carboxypeptidase/D-alanyl-D-alanine-endopeptidase (Penicillin-binding protein 4) n=1 Tax=Gelidibacter sediminis TaxID=1608710 RepID=A0A4R7Q9J8_9FLAO|nr:D-alanyl-D-alanine carboxypeptidase [Gelidibacter sediminis]TDU43629.1 D-alanyl-D-alanine carboxypeptidase/D-alanyl-D-alanine-endopeptidase (penicillin-binding protein 4) [Gelidibacter sediminis]
MKQVSSIPNVTKLFGRYYVFMILSLVLVNCKSAKISKHLHHTLNSSFYDNQFTGLMVYNPKTKDTVFSHNGNRYFTPASNTKIFTLYTALQYLPDQIPALKYAIDQDTLIVKGTGDPSFLHPYFKDSTALNFMKSFNAIQLVTANYHNEKFGPGWAWEDYDMYYSPERSAFPMYGNVATIWNTGQLATYPEFLKGKTTYSELNSRRDFNTNTFFYKITRKDTIEVPFVVDSTLLRQLWDDLLPGKVKIIPNTKTKTDQTLYSVASDSVYKRMMQVSDNFLAEQLLILASSTVSDTLDADKVRKSILDKQLNDLKQKPYWVDGSGLSRYNLFTPLSFVQVLEKLYADIPRERLFNFFPVGGKSGTIKSWYAGNTVPYVYAKTGTVGNVHCLSGYLLTNSGEVLIFSFMNNNYRTSTTKVKEQMQTVLEYLRDTY